MTDKIEAATQALNSAKEALATATGTVQQGISNATGVATEAAKAGVKAVAQSELAATAGSMATSAASEIGQAASSLAKAGSKWAYIWMAQRMAEQVLATVVSIAMVIAIVYVVTYFMRSFVKQIKAAWESRTFVDRVSANIKHQIELDNTKLLEDVSRNKDDVHDKIVELTKKVKRFADVQAKYEFEPLKKQLHDVLSDYKRALDLFETRVTQYEGRMRDVERSIKEHYKKR